MPADGAPHAPGASVSPDERSFGLLAMVGAALSAPVLSRDDAAGAISDATAGRMSAEACQALMGDATFGRHMALIARPGPSVAAPLDDSFVSRLAVTPLSRLAVILATAPRDHLDRVVALLAGAALQRQFICAVTKAERAALKAALPPEAQALAVDEAPVLYPELAELPTPESVDNEHAMALGQRILFAWVREVEPALAPLLLQRLSLAGQAAMPEWSLDRRKLRLVEKLILRKCPEWTTVVS
ncbi:MAG: hypothetical protein AAFV96_07065 [Pseudomonadota bacterium]